MMLMMAVVVGVIRLYKMQLPDACVEYLLIDTSARGSLPKYNDEDGDDIKDENI